MSDAEVRRQALDPARSILLQAPAGSGKTTVLALRFLTLLAVVNEPEEILAITFTRKAAAEMRERVQKSLRGELDPAAPAFAQWSAARDRVLQRARDRGWELSELPLRLRIQTIDALNQYLATQLPLFEAGAGTWQVTDEARPLYERAARRTLLDAERDPALREPMGMLLERLDNRWERAEELLADMLGKRAQWLPQILGTPPELLAARVSASLQAIAAETLQRATACIAARERSEMHALATAAAAQRLALGMPAGSWQLWLEPPEQLGAHPDHLGHWREFAALGLTAKGTWRSRITRNEGFPPTEKALKSRFETLLGELALRPGARDCLVALRDLPPLRMQQQDAAALAGLARILKLAATELQLVFAQAGRVDHTLIAGAAREALGESDAPSELAMRFGTALRHLLVDEFQDTSVEQFALLEALVGGWQSSDGRSLFLVGDPMQSIYQFRAAEVGLFLRARAQGIGAVRLEALALTRNFRSLPVVTEWVNATFAQLLPASDDLRSSAVSFLAAQAAGSAALPGEVTLHALDSPAAETEAQRVLALVRQARARDPAASVAVLVASRRHATRIAATLRHAGVPVRGVDLEPLAARPAVRDLTALAQALLRPADRSAWLAVLRAPWCGLSLLDLTMLCGDGEDALVPELLADPARFAALAPDARANLVRCAPLLLAAAGCSGRMALAALLESIWLRLGGPDTCDAAALRDAERFFVALAARESEDPLDEAALERLTRDLYAQGESDAAEAVEVLTIHRAKGLEWDVVLLPGLGHRMQSDTAPLLRWIELPRSDAGTDLLMATLSLGDPDATDPLNGYIKGLQKERLRNEKLRLAYVAATRARRELHLLGHAPLDARSGVPRPAASSLLDLLWPVLERQYVAGVAAPALTATPARSRQWLYRLPADWRAPALPPDIGVPAPPSEQALVPPEYSWVGQTARAIGTVVHAQMQALAQVATWPPVLGEQRTRCDTALRQLGVAAAARPGAIARIEAALQTLVADERAAWIFSPMHRERAAELRLSGVVDERVVNVSIDRTFIDAAGTRWVIDFKTSTHEGSDLQGFLDREAERYAPQLQRYAQLARELGPEPVRCALYFPLLGAFRELLV